MTHVHIVIPGKPYAKKRHRSFFNKNLGRAISVNPPENKSFESKVAEIALPHFPSPLRGPVRLTILLCFAPAASLSKRKRQDLIASRYHAARPDADNVLKAVKDGLNRVAWADDCQVSAVVVTKVWGEVAGTHIGIEAIPDFTRNPSDKPQAGLRHSAAESKNKCGDAGAGNATHPLTNCKLRRSSRDG